jgi:phospholipid/cholesterol/gamma-HCH transport system ATP-binding protein
MSTTPTMTEGPPLEDHPTDPVDGSAHEAGNRLRRTLHRALDADPELARRLSRARTSVRFSVGDTEHGGTLLLDRDPPSFTDADEPAEIEIGLTTAQARRLADGDLSIAAGAFAGAVSFQGPVRKYLEVDPILQGLIGGETLRAERPRLGDDGERSKSAPESDLLAIDTQDVWKAFGSHQVLQGVDLRVPEGVISVVLGPSGTGKSVLFQHVLGLLAPDRGEVRLRGAAIGDMRRSEMMALRRTIGVMFQDGAMFSAMTVFENVAFPLREHTDLSDREIDEIVALRLRDVGLESAANIFPRQLSPGMRKRAGLARALVLDPGILLCDEPDSGLDPVRTALIGDLLTDQHARGGGVILVVTHDIALTRQIADHVSVLWDGKIVESGLAEDVFASDDEFVRQFLDGQIDGPLSMD